MLVVSAAASVALLLVKGKDYAYYTTIARMPEFLLGVVAYSMRERLAAQVNGRQKFRAAVATGSVAAALAACVFCSAKTEYAGAFAYVPSMAAVGILLFGGGIAQRALSWRGLVRMGGVSYEFFLIHWPILALLRYRLNVSVLPFWVGVVALVAAFGLAIGWRWLMQRINGESRPIAVYGKNAVAGGWC